MIGLLLSCSHGWSLAVCMPMDSMMESLSAVVKNLDAF